MPPSGAVEVWVADLSGASEELLRLLSPQERERASRLLDDRARLHWSVSRAVLRDLLAGATGEDPRRLRFELGGNGKPYLRRSSSDGPRFNLSHSGSLALYAISWEREVGVDVEVLERGRGAARNEVAIARRMLGPEVAARLASLDPEARHRELLAAWVAHEALVKCLGVGIGQAYDRLAEAVAEPGGAAPVGAAPAPWLTPLDVGEQALAALAVQGGEAVVQMRRWEAPGARA